LTAARFRLSRRQGLVGQDKDHEREETRFPLLRQTQFKIGSAWISKIESLRRIGGGSIGGLRDLSRGMKRLDHGSDVAVLENQASGLPCFADGNIHHGARQVVGRNDLIGEQHPKQRVDRAQQPVAEVRFLPDAVSAVVIPNLENSRSQPQQCHAVPISPQPLRLLSIPKMRPVAHMSTR
jgi:hypothetical protein